MSPFTKLPDDVVDLILQQASDFTTLHSLILASKRIHAIYELHLRTISRCVAWNLTGALPQALRAARHYSREWPKAYDDEPPDNYTLDIHSTSEDVPDDTNISNEDKEELSCYASCASELEDLFSQRYKDPGSKTSKLTPDESWRFRRAIYRIILFCKIFNTSLYSSFDEEADGIDDIIDETNLAKESFLAHLASDDLVQIYAAAAFLVSLVGWVHQCFRVNIPSTQLTDHFVLIGTELCAGPERILETFKEDQILYHLDTPIPVQHHTEGYLSLPLESLWAKRGFNRPAEPIVSILNSYQLGTCARCGEATPDVWNPSNCDILQFHTELKEGSVSSFLLGNLRFNQKVVQRLRAEWVDIQHMLDGLFDVKTPDYAGVAKTDLLCSKCLKEFICAHLHLWLLQKIRACGEPAQEDCWYGYNCRTQTHNVSHAAKLNHLCQQTR